MLYTQFQIGTGIHLLMLMVVLVEYCGGCVPLQRGKHTLEDSDIECDGVQAKYSTSQSVSKKLKVSDFAEQVLPTKK